MHPGPLPDHATAAARDLATIDVAVHRHRGDDECDTSDFDDRGHLGEHDDANDRRRRRQQRHEQAVGRTGHAAHGQLIEHIGDHRGADADTDPGQQRDRVEHDACRRGAAERCDHQRGHDHRGREPVDATEHALAADAVSQQHVAGEQRGVGGSEREAGRRTGKSHIDQRGHTRDRQQQRPDVAGRAHTHDRERHRSHELDRGDGAERNLLDRHVEAHVHDRQHRAPRDDRGALVAWGARPRPPRTSPACEDGARAGDPQPCHTEDVHAGEQQHGQRGTQIVEHRAADEERPRRNRTGAAPQRHWRAGDDRS